MVRGLRTSAWGFGLILTIFGLSFSVAQGVRLKGSVDSTRYQIGEWIDLRVSVDADDGVASISPMIGDTLGAFEILRTVAPSGSRTEKPAIWTFRLIAFEPGERVVIPPLEFQYTMENDPGVPRSAFTAPLPLIITGMEIDPAGDIKDIREPLTPPWMFEDSVPYLILLAALAALAAGYYFFRRRKRPEIKLEAGPPVPAHQVALSALRELEEKRLWQQGKTKEYYSEVTEIVRRFFEGRFGIEALELTSGEILQQLKSLREAESHWKEINAFFLTADLVKFATYRPTPEENESELRWAYEIVRALIPKPTVHESETLEATDVR